MTTQCGICHVPIGIGEPVAAYDDGLAHRFKTDCDWHIAKDAEFVKVMERMML